jgi:type IV pilus assembly protein PilN
MIRINLLSGRRTAGSKKAIELRKFLAITGGILGLVLVVGLGVGYMLDSRLDKLAQQRAIIQQDLTALKSKAAEIANFESDRDAFERKIDVIKQLRTNQSQPVMLLDQVARNLPERAWLLRMEASGNELTMVGRAMGNSDIVEMMRRMKQVEVIDNLQLVESRRISEKGLSAYEFTLTGQLTKGGRS